MGKKSVYLSAGHSGKGENGVVSKWLNEREAAIELRDMVREKSRMLVGLKLSSDGRRLKERVDEADRFCGVKSGVAVEIHFNSGGSGTGTECVVSDRASGASRKVARKLVDAVSDVLGLKNRGVKNVSDTGHTRLAFVDDTLCPAVILEVCFATNEGDCRVYEEKKEDLAFALAKFFDSVEF